MAWFGSVDFFFGRFGFSLICLYLFRLVMGLRLVFDNGPRAAKLGYCLIGLF